MACPQCGSTELAVVDSRPHPLGIRRRRQCAAGHRFTTFEIHERTLARFEKIAGLYTSMIAAVIEAGEIGL